MSLPEDHDLPRSIAARNPDALDALYDRYGRIAFGLAYRVLGDSAAAGAVVQDAFPRVWRQAGSFDRQRGSVGSWLRSIVHHRAIDLLRGRYGRRRRARARDGVEHTLASPDGWGEVSPRRERQTARAAARTLPDSQRAAIEMAYFEGLTYRDIAKRTGEPLGTIKSRIRLGRRKLHDALTASGVHEGSGAIDDA